MRSLNFLIAVFLLSSCYSETLNEPLIANPEGHEFKIVADYSLLQMEYPELQDYFTKVLIPSAMDYIKATFKLKYPTSNSLTAYTDPKLVELCTGVDESLFHNQNGADLVLVPRAVSTDIKAIAITAACYKDSKTKRATVATIDFNLRYYYWQVVEKDSLKHEDYLSTTIHEILHALGFGKFFYEDYLLPNGTPNQNAIKNVIRNGKNVTVLNVEPLTSKLRKHFGCENIEGAWLENNGESGSAGSHFEETIFYGEVMNAATNHDVRISEFSLAALEGTGWYYVDYSKAEPYTAGQGSGCGYYNGLCMTNTGHANFDEFCSKNDDMRCSENLMSGARCGTSGFGFDCLMPKSQDIFDCRNPETKQYVNYLKDVQIFGQDSKSRCFAGTLTRKDGSFQVPSFYCFDFKCRGEGSNTVVDVIIGGITQTCTVKGQFEVEGYDGKLNCPDPLEFCSKAEKVFCPKGCSGRGECKEGKCICPEGFVGKDCSWPVAI